MIPIQYVGLQIKTLKHGYIFINQENDLTSIVKLELRMTRTVVSWLILTKNLVKATIVCVLNLSVYFIVSMTKLEEATQ